MLSRLAFNSTRRVASARTAFAVRTYAGRSDGSVAQSDTFNKREKAHEDQYVREHEKQVLEKLRKSIEEKKNELSKLEAEAEKAKEQK
ncbi:hypothetical protein BDV98DRAFT_603205 [Pterulicium gracile]|uniref:ATPase inhibitor, mitochondrial n=1 Tax=Pterulicium gracile TaxID=1884261 RepID=A0A5C3QWU9_9AGAR|nr:hypothetical protein BDV98DRAFT_603205 [Pterula gracilis]